MKPVETGHHEVDLDAALSPELFQKIKAIQIRTQRVVNEVFAGEYESAFKGRGMEFEEVREYQPGDDIRHIDWNVTARMSAPFVKVHREERELTVMLLVDVSSSGAFGSGTKLKNEVAAEVAALLAYTAIKSNDRVGLIIFSDRIEHYIPPKKGRAHVWRVIRDILTFRPSRRATDLEGALEYMSKVTRRRAVAFIISDFLDEGFSDRLRVVSRRHDVTAVTIGDQREMEMPRIGILELEDAETGETILIDTYDKNVTDGFRLLSHDQRTNRNDFFRSAGAGEVAVRADDPDYVESLVRYFHSRERRR
ncbi:MAG: DUF58 domain-containing protein [Deltaproteobacteria bacterium]|nr:DUF58 domain-containing protein [Deltaproteobacteria bacterium]